MFMQVFIECERRLHHEKGYVKFFRENSSFWSFWTDSGGTIRSSTVKRRRWEFGPTPLLKDLRTTYHSQSRELSSGSSSLERQVGQLAPFDLVLLLVLSNSVQNQ